MQYLFYISSAVNILLLIVIAMYFVRTTKKEREIEILQSEVCRLLREQLTFRHNTKLPEKIIINQQTPSNLEDIKAYVIALEKRLFHYFRLSENSTQLSELQDYIQKREGVEFAHEKRHALIKTKML